MVLSRFESVLFGQDSVFFAQDSVFFAQGSIFAQGSFFAQGSIFAQDNGLGDGRIDNFIVDSSAHVISGVIVLLTMTVALVLCGRRAVGGHALDSAARWSVLVAQVSLGIQALLGIKLLDQGQGIGQLYIHYVGGLMPLGAFLAGGWLLRTDTVKGTRWLTILVGIGWFSAVMAFFIGRAYVNR